jgi:mannose-6-phosphate isomerase
MPLRGPRANGPVTELLAPQASKFFTAQRIVPAGACAHLDRGFAVVIVTDGAGTIANFDVARGDAILVPHAAGRVIVDGDLVAIACRPPKP